MCAICWCACTIACWMVSDRLCDWGMYVGRSVMRNGVSVFIVTPDGPASS